MPHMNIDSVKDKLLIRAAFAMLERSVNGSLLIRDKYWLDLLKEIGLFGPSSDGDTYDTAMAYCNWLRDHCLNDMLPTIKEANQASEAKNQLIQLQADISRAEDILSSLKTCVHHNDSLATINRDELADLRKSSHKLSCLIIGGVDNWDGYDDSLDDFRDRYPNG